MRSDVSTEADILFFLKGEGTNHRESIDILSGNVCYFASSFRLLFRRSSDAVCIEENKHKENWCDGKCENCVFLADKEHNYSNTE